VNKTFVDCFFPTISKEHHKTLIQPDNLSQSPNYTPNTNKTHEFFVITVLYGQENLIQEKDTNNAG
jgi:hypothetical protein